MSTPGPHDAPGVTCDVLRIDADWPALTYDGSPALAAPALWRGGWIELPPCPSTLGGCTVGNIGTNPQETPPLVPLGAAGAYLAVAVVLTLALKRNIGV